MLKSSRNTRLRQGETRAHEIPGLPKSLLDDAVITAGTRNVGRSQVL